MLFSSMSRGFSNVVCFSSILPLKFHGSRCIVAMYGLRGSVVVMHCCG